MILLYMDENVQGAITRGLRRRGVGVLAVQEDDRAAADDLEVLRRATVLERLLFTRDDDLLREATDCQRRGESFSGVVYAHQLLVSIGKCVVDLELIALANSPEEYTSRIAYSPL